VSSPKSKVQVPRDNNANNSLSGIFRTRVLDQVHSALQPLHRHRKRIRWVGERTFSFFSFLIFLFSYSFSSSSYFLFFFLSLSFFLLPFSFFFFFHFLFLLLSLFLFFISQFFLSPFHTGSDEQIEEANRWQEDGKLGCFSLTEKFAGKTAIHCFYSFCRLSG
jgi:hypothetical protein